MLSFREMLTMLMPPSVYDRRRIAEEVAAGKPELDLLSEQMHETTFRKTQVHEAGPA